MSANTSEWQGRRAFVIGCTGFLGRAVTRELIQNGAIAVGLVGERNQAKEFAREFAAGQMELVHGLVEDVYRLHSAMAVHEVSVVFNLVSSDRGTAAVTYAANRYHPGIPVVAARPAFQLRVAEHTERPQNPLGIARFGELFGPSDRDFVHSVSRMAVALLRGQPMPTGASHSRDFVFVRDAARACLMLAETVTRECQSFDVTFQSGWEFTDSAMAAQMADAISKKVLHTQMEVPSNPLAWQPETTLHEALRESVEWYRELLDREGEAFHPNDVRKAA